MPSTASLDANLTVRRQRAMAICAAATFQELDAALKAVAYRGATQDLRAPEAGLVMARGRIGGEGRPFNFGEATVARAAVRIESGETGFAYLLGRDLRKARHAAVIDALVQSPLAGPMEQALAPIAGRIAAEAEERARETQATRVNFFTMVRGED